MDDKDVLANLVAFSKNHRSGDVSIATQIIKIGRELTAALSSDIGQKILGDTMMLMREKAKKILDDEATDDDKALYRAYRNIVGIWAQRIESYYKQLNLIKENADGKQPRKRSH